MRPIAAALLACVFCAGAGRLHAQDLTGALEGTVTGAAGEPVAGAAVELRMVGSGTVLTTRSDRNGVYRFPTLLPGAYALSASLTGLEPFRVDGIRIALGRAVKLDAVLRLRREREVEVRGAAPLLDLGQSGSFTNVRDLLVTALPNGRDYTSLATRAPSANQEPKLAGIAIDGSGANENRYMVDGIDTANLMTGLPGKQVVVDFVDEVQVTSSGIQAEFGGSTGGVVNLLTKSGTNALSGSAGAYFSSDALNASARPYLRLKPNDVNSIEWIDWPDDRMTRWEPGFTLGGPVVRDRAWFFVGYIPQLTTTSRTVTFVADSSTRTFTQKEMTSFTTANVTLQPASNLFARLSLNLSPYERSGSLPSQDGNSSPATPYADLGQTQSNTSVAGSLELTASPALHLGLRGGYYRSDVRDKGIPNGVRYSFDGTNAMFPEIPPDLRGPTGFTNLATNQATERDVNTRASLQLDGTLFASWLGQHALKGGVQYDRLGNDVVQGEQAPNVTLFWDRTLTTLDGRRVRGTYGYYRVQQRQTLGNVASDNVGLFLQDTWSLGNRLTLTRGVRTESEKVPNYSDAPGAPKYAIDFGFQDKLAPRLGFAWDVAGDGKWKGFGSWGVYYDTTKLSLPRSSFGGEKWLDYRFSLDTYDWPTIVKAWCPPACPGVFYEVVDYRYEGTIDPDLKPMRSQELTIGLQREISPKTVAGIRYVHKQLDRAVEDVGVIVPGIGEVYTIANPGFGLANHTLGDQYPAQPKAVRDYDAVELDVTRRMSDRWMLHASYVWSRLWGNYSGLASSDRYGRTTPNVDRVFDSLPTSFDQNARPVYGLLGTDRTHRFKAEAVYLAPTATTVGATFLAASGTPISRYVEMQSNVPVYYMGRGSDGRTPTLTQTDLFLQQDVRLGGLVVQLTLNVLNLFNQATVTSVASAETLDVIAISNDDFFKGYDVKRLIAQQNIRRNPLFLQPDAFQAPRTVRLGAKVAF